MISITRIFLLVLIVQLAGCKAPQGTTVAEKRADVMNMHDDVLATFYEAKPFLEERVANAPGYGVFSNFGLKIFVLGSGNGFGVVHENATDQDTFMRMFEINVGLGFGGKNFRALFIFNTEEALRNFTTKGWDFGGDAEVGVMVDDDGGELGAAGSLGPIEIYQYSKTGIMLSATVGGTKYRLDDELN
ncbi:MAG: YSC84-related protein [Planctomycetota bacterium]|nr:YSC84-related protein [Planctomycetota bacterium]